MVDLQKVADALNAREGFRARVKGGVGGVRLSVTSEWGLYAIWYGHEDHAHLSFELLNDMEARGWRVRLERYHLDEGGFPFYVSWRRGEEEPSFGEKPKPEGFYSFEETRTLAVVKAFLGTLEIEASSGLLNKTQEAE